MYSGMHETNVITNTFHKKSVVLINSASRNCNKKFESCIMCSYKFDGSVALNVAQLTKIILENDQRQ